MINDYVIYVTPRQTLLLIIQIIKKIIQIQIILDRFRKNSTHLENEASNEISTVEIISFPVVYARIYTVLEEKRKRKARRNGWKKEERRKGERLD